MEKLSVQEIIQNLESKEKKENARAIQYLFHKTQDQVAHFVLRNGGGPEDIDDLYQDAFISLLKLVKNGRIEEVKDIEAYLYTICRNLWFKRFNKEKRNVELGKEQENIPVAETSTLKLLTQERAEAIEVLMKRLGESCHQILQYYYYDRLSMKEIAVKMNFSSDAVAKNKKSTCLKKLKALVLDSSHYQTLLSNLET